MRPTMIWLVALVCVVATAAGAAQFGPDQYPIKSDEGDPITNFDLKPELSARLAKLPGQVAVGDEVIVHSWAGPSPSTAAAEPPLTATASRPAESV